MKVCSSNVSPHILLSIKMYILFFSILGASVWKFSVEVDGRQIQDVVKETVEAEADYNEALRSGKSAFMMQEKLADVFMVGSLKYFALTQWAGMALNKLRKLYW